jgi:DNA polymerase (family X)
MRDSLLFPSVPRKGTTTVGILGDTSAVAALDNARIGEELERFASLLDLSGASYYSVRAYRRAAELLRATPAPVAELVRTGRIRELSGIGPGIEARLRELVETGRIAELDELASAVKPELVGFGRLIGLSPKRVVSVAEALGVSTPAELSAAAHEGRLREAPGIGPVAEAKILRALERDRAAPRQGLLLNRAWALTESIAEALGGETAGDPRRYCDLSYRLAVVVAAADAGPVLDRFARLPQIVSILERGGDRAVGVTVDGVPVEVTVAPRASFGTALLRATGSPDYVAALGTLPDAPTEDALYRAVGRAYVPPELREVPEPSAPPALVELDDVRGDLHVHSTWSDGKASVLEMGLAARNRGYDYLAICDHTTNVRVVPGLDADALRRQGEEIADANEVLAPFRLLRGTECDILNDGSLDLPDDVLAELDWVQASVHAGQRQSREQLTQRMSEAARHPAVRSISHPQGRILNHRPPNAVDLERLFAVCVETGTAIETNGLPDRIDLSAELIRDALAAGVTITASTDAHSVRGLANMQLAIGTARRGGAGAGRVLNTRPLEEVLRRSDGG